LLNRKQKQPPTWSKKKTRVLLSELQTIDGKVCITKQKTTKTIRSRYLQAISSIFVKNSLSFLPWGLIASEQLAARIQFALP